ncbi:MAG: hypothetical protein NC429_07200 [Lachnospiraceae bacterium]|nr:hypothetical protein [Lachnospiraceae bacterium]
MGKAGFELEMGSMQFEKGFENCTTLAVFAKKGEEIFRIEAEGQKVLKGEAAYPEIISAPFASKREIRFFFEVIKKFCMKAGEKTFSDSLKILEEYAGSRATGTPAELPVYRSVVKAKNPFIQTNLNIPYSRLYQLNLGEDFEKAKAIAGDMIAKYGGTLQEGLKKRLLSFFAQLAYQTYVYTRYEIVPTEFCYPDYAITKEMLEDVESHEGASTGTKASSAKLKFEVLLKASQAESLSKLFTEEERAVLLAVLNNYSGLWDSKFKNARGGQAVREGSYSFAKIKRIVGQNIDAGNGKKGAEFVFTEPRIASIIEIRDSELVIELRKDKNPVNSFLRDYCNCRMDKELRAIEELFPLLKECCGIEFSD